MMNTVKYKIKINVLTPFNIASGENKGGLIDKYTIRHNNKPYIPASTIKGKLRDNFIKLTNANHFDKDCNCISCKLFGKQGYSPSKIYIDDFYTEESPKITIKYGNAIDRYRKVAKDSALYSEEIVSNKVFLGEVTVYFKEDTIKYKQDLELAFKMIDFIGNGKSRGHGYVEIEIEEVN